MRLPRLPLGRLLALAAIVLAAVVVVGGGGTYVAMSVTTKPEFCASCHIMEPYVESWRNSSHKDVACVDCHYEPGLLETFEGKFKALSQLAKYVTSTQGTKPWAEVSDFSCMRSGCHSNRLLEGEIQFGRIRFDHRHHLIDLKRGKKLRCTSCHSQIVQGESHLTVTTTTCILCHFRAGEGEESNDDCNTCHGPPPEAIDLDGFVFRHGEYLARGVDCKDCHGDITRGTGDVPRARCGSCHNRQEHLDRYDDVEFMHRHHVTDHSVACLECHTEIEHGLTPRKEHYAGACADCHEKPHAVSSGIYQGLGGREVEDDPSVMFRARVTCTGCHRPPFPDAPTPPPGTTWAADPLACIDCHGPGFDGMADHWQAEIRATTAQTKAALEVLAAAIDEAGKEAPPASREAYAAAAHNLGLVLLDRSDGVHNLTYTRALLQRAAEDLATGAEALGTPPTLPKIEVGPRVASDNECTTMCHTGIESVAVPRFGRYGFSHAPHFLKAGLDCSDCHAMEPHGTTIVKPSMCIECHHEDAVEEENCDVCHVDVVALRELDAPDDEASMLGVDCIGCHESVADEHSLDAVMSACFDCHDEDEGIDTEAWFTRVDPSLRMVEKRLAGSTRSEARAIRRELVALRAAGPFHHGAAAEAAVARWMKQMDDAEAEED